ncbi:MAG: hypothetical protein M0R17_04085 [Candidatus Omnitrophica bacterium]|jgi:hypothetical protein|nr:hypothetical protein [Candidatus Omnitrophota bacterium]
MSLYDEITLDIVWPNGKKLYSRDFQTHDLSNSLCRHTITNSGLFYWEDICDPFEKIRGIIILDGINETLKVTFDKHGILSRLAVIEYDRNDQKYKEAVAIDWPVEQIKSYYKASLIEAFKFYPNNNMFKKGSSIFLY